MWGLSSELTSFPTAPWTWSSIGIPESLQRLAHSRSQTFLRAAAAQQAHSAEPVSTLLPGGPGGVQQHPQASSALPSKPLSLSFRPVKRGISSVAATHRIPSQSPLRMKWANMKSARHVTEMQALFSLPLSYLSISSPAWTAAWGSPSRGHQRSIAVLQGSAGHVPALQESPGAVQD